MSEEIQVLPDSLSGNVAKLSSIHTPGVAADGELSLDPADDPDLRLSLTDDERGGAGGGGGW